MCSGMPSLQPDYCRAFSRDLYRAPDRPNEPPEPDPPAAPAVRRKLRVVR